MYKYGLIFFSALFWAQQVCAQTHSLIPERKLRFQIEAGCNYSYFLDKPHYFNEFDLPFKGFSIGQKNLKNYISHFSIKAIYKNKHAITYTSSFYQTDMSKGSRFTYPGTGLISVYYDIASLGYGYILNFNNVNITLGTQLCYREGLESYISHWSPPPYDEPWAAFLTYTNPWGCSFGAHADYFITRNIGLGLNLTYYMFPFEDGRLDESSKKTNPELYARSFANKQIFTAGFKAFYNFALPKSLNKLNPFKKK